MRVDTPKTHYPRLTGLGALLALALAPGEAPALDLSTGELEARLDTTLSWGVAWRVSGRDDDIVGIANGGNAYSVNGDDGNLNYDRGVVSNIAKITSELDLRWRNFGAFVRGKAFYDFEQEDSDRDRTDRQPALGA